MQCKAIADSAARLACFDAASAKMEQAAEAEDIVILDCAELRKTKRSLFGFLMQIGSGGYVRVKRVS